MTRYIGISTVGLLALLVGACEATDTNTATGANEEALSAEDGGAPVKGFRGHGRRGPLPQAIEACANLEDGASCSFDSPRRGNVEGTCMDHPRVDGLSCVPEGRFGKGRFGKGQGHGFRGPPPQAVEACANLEDGASCSFESRRGDSVEGTCMDHPRVDGLSCVPADRFGKGRFGKGHGRGFRGPPPQAVEACANLEDGASCSFESRRGDSVEGTCMNHPGLDSMSCVPEGRFGKGRFGKGFGRGHGRGGPPPESVDACANLEIGAACSFEGCTGEMQGTCLEHPRRGGVACAPEGHFGHGFRGGLGAAQQ